MKIQERLLLPPLANDKRTVSQEVVEEPKEVLPDPAFAQASTLLILFFSLVFGVLVLFRRVCYDLFF